MLPKGKDMVEVERNLEGDSQEEGIMVIPLGQYGVRCNQLELSNALLAQHQRQLQHLQQHDGQ